MKRRVRGLLDRVLLTTWRACLESVDDRIHRDAAQVGFFAMLSFVPLALLLVAAFGLVFDDADVRTRVVKTVFENIPLSAEDDRARLEATVSDALDPRGPDRAVLDPAADRGGHGDHGRAAPHHQRGVGHPRPPAAAAPQGARPRARARRDHRARPLARGHRHPQGGERARRRGGRRRSSRGCSTSSATRCRSSSAAA